MSAGNYLEEDGVITTIPSKLLSVVLTPDSQGVADIAIYDGQGAESGYVKLKMRTGVGITQQCRFEHMVFDRGIYVDIGSNVTSVTIEWEPVGYPGAVKDGWVHLRDDFA